MPNKFMRDIFVEKIWILLDLGDGEENTKIES
jgi:hypothetical protein